MTSRHTDCLRWSSTSFDLSYILAAYVCPVAFLVASLTTAYAPSPSLGPNENSSFTFSGERWVLNAEGFSSLSSVISVKIVYEVGTGASLHEVFTVCKGWFCEEPSAGISLHENLKLFCTFWATACKPYTKGSFLRSSEWWIRFLGRG